MTFSKILDKVLCKDNIIIREALKTLNKAATGCLIIINEKGKLVGTLSDGDIRRCILSKRSLNGTINNLYTKSPLYLVDGQYNDRDVKNIFLKCKISIIPIVDSNKMVIDFLHNIEYFSDDQAKKEKFNNLSNVPVVIMAGGKGTRLEPFTHVLPKPLVPIREKPIIEHIIERFTELGCSDFYLTANYKGKILKAYFEELQPNYDVHFVEEKQSLGSAGSLRFLDGKLNLPFFVTNCDTIIKAEYTDLYEFHQKNDYDVTLVASAKEYVIPYGTCELNSEGHLSHIKEKPRYDLLINTGLYVLNTEVLKLIPKNRIYHMTNLIEDAKNHGKKVGVFPIDDDDWIDVGQWAEYQKAVERL